MPISLQGNEGWIMFCESLERKLQYKTNQMKHMTCINHREAELICISPECPAKCSYVCIQTPDTCRNIHQSCSMVFVSYLLRKSNKMIAKAQDFQIEKLISFQKSTKKIMQTLDNYLESYHLLSNINNILVPHGLLEPRHKQTIAQFMNSNMKLDPQMSISSLQQNLSELNVELTTYLTFVKDQRKKQQELKSKRQPNGRISSTIRSKLVIPTPVKSGLKNNNSGISSKMKDQHQAITKEVSNFQQPYEVSSRPVTTSTIKQKPPFYSKITNDVQTIYNFFSNKFSQVKLLYRASENEFSVAKFHEKCDGIQNTITLVETEGEKIIGGFTPLPWRAGGGEWYGDTQEKTFLFSLNSRQRYPLVNKQKAIWCSQAYGPSFGYPDLQIADKAAYHSNSNANFPQCFNNGNYTLSTGSTQMFCGSKNGRFKIKEWEVYELIF